MVRILGVLCLLAWQCMAQAQQPARILVGFPAGGSLDVVARYVAESIRDVVGRPVIVDNRPGAAGRLAVEAAKAAPPDGNTLVFVPSGPMTLFPHTFRDLRFDPFKDFTPISQLATLDLCIASGPGTPARSLAELRDWAKANPQKASYGSAGTGTGQHFTGVLFGQLTGLKLVHVPYKGAGPATTDLAAGHVPMLVLSCNDLLELHRAGRVRILASAGPVRSPFTPEVPTLVESGLKIDRSSWFALYGPAGMPPATVRALNKAVVDAVSSAQGRQHFLKMGLVATGTSPEDLTRVQRIDFDTWGAVAKSSGFKPED
jgi:tripartite-type tricarboxylate transporter receptor subunit TctC